MDKSKYTNKHETMINKDLPNQISLVPASLYQRFAAFVIDVVVIYGTAICFSLGLGVIGNLLWIMLFALFFSWLYLTFHFYKEHGQTIGSRVFGIKVISVDGSELDFWRALQRSILVSSMISPIGFVSILSVILLLSSLLSLNLKPTKQRRQTAWDAMTNTRIIKSGSKIKWKEW